MDYKIMEANIIRLLLLFISIINVTLINCDDYSYVKENSILACHETGPSPPRATNLQGLPIPSLTASQSVYPSGVMLFQDFHLLDKLNTFNMEKIPVRVVHAKGVGAHGHFIVTHDISKYTKAKFLNGIGKKTPVFVRFSQTNSDIATPDTALDDRGFAIKFYTEDGNHDLVASTIGSFGVRDPMLFRDLNRSKKRNPVTNLMDRNKWWDFVSQRPESTFNLLQLFSDDGKRDGYRRMSAFGLHAFKFVNANDEYVWAKFEIRSLTQGRALTNLEMFEFAKNDTEYFSRDLFNAIERGEYPKWNVTIRIMTAEQAKNYTRNPFDITRRWINVDVIVLPIGIMTLDRNPVDYFTEVEQVGFAPSNMVPGIEPSPDKMLQARMFSYADAQRYRIGVNGPQLPINKPLTPVNSYQRSGLGCYGDNGEGGPNYFPNSFGGPEPELEAKELPFDVEGWVDRYPNENQDEFVESRNLLDQMKAGTAPQGRIDDLVDSIAYWLKDAKEDIRERVYRNNFYPISKAFGDLVRDATEKAVGNSRT